MSKNQPTKYVQGDVVLRRISKLPANVKPLESTNPGAKILQKSEVTGHHHQFQATSVVDMYVKTERDVSRLDELDFTTITENDGKYIVVRDTDALLFHGRECIFDPHAAGVGDHKALSITPGIYEVDIVREYNYDLLEVRRVVD